MDGELPASTAFASLILPRRRGKRTRSREAADCGCLRIVDIENGQQLCYLQDFVKFSTQIAEAQGCTQSFGADVRSDQSAQPRAVDIFNIGHVQDDLLLSCGDQTLQFLTERIALLAQHNLTVQCHHGHAFYFAVGHSYSHAHSFRAGTRLHAVSTFRSLRSALLLACGKHSVVVQANSGVAFSLLNRGYEAAFA